MKDLYRSTLNKLPFKANTINPWMLRPFTNNDLAPVKNSGKDPGPDFVGIASPKAGTSWWYALLQDHPQIIPNRLNSKELSYFHHFSYYGLNPKIISTYNQAFISPIGTICGEWSPGYLAYPLAINYLAQAAPNTKLLAIIRNPVDSVISHLNQISVARARYLKLNKNQSYIFYVHSAFREAMTTALVSNSFSKLLELFDESQLFVLQYEKCKENPVNEIAKTYRFLGVDDSYVPERLNQKINMKPYVIPKLDKDERTFLIDYYEDDVNKLLKLFPQIDLSLWPDFK